MKNGKKLRSPLTDSQKPWYEALCKWIETEGYPPTLKEWANQRGMVAQAASKARIALRDAGYITFSERKSRSIQLVA